MRKSKRDKKVKKVFNATTEKMKLLITNENDLKIFTYYFNAEHNQFSERVAGIMASVSLSLLSKNLEERRLLLALAKKQIDEILPEMREATKPPSSLVVLMSLFELNEMLINYLKYENRLIKALKDDKLVQNNFDFRDALVKNIGNITAGDMWEDLGYDMVYAGKLKVKFEEILAWIPKGVARLVKYNKPFVDIKQLEILEEKRVRVLESLKMTVDFCEEVKEKEPVQVNIFREMMSRILMVRYELRHSLENEIKDKSDIKYLKTLVTKLEKLFSWQYNLIETGDDGCE
nr:MAG TPA: hypothetical protein [Caudoviricetes sp.]